MSYEVLGLPCHSLLVLVFLNRDRHALFPHVRHQGHEPGSLDGVLDGALEGGAVAAALAAKNLALVRAQLLERLHVLVIDERRPRTALTRAKPAAILPTSSELLTDHGVVPYSQRQT